MNLPRLSSINNKLGKFVLAAGVALSTGGIHIPNHRWVVSSAPAQINSLFPSAVDRIDDWLGEGVYCDSNGQFAKEHGHCSPTVTESISICSGSDRSATETCSGRHGDLSVESSRFFAVATFLIMYGAFLALKSAHQADLPSQREIVIAGQPVRLSVEPASRVVAFCAALLIGGVTGTTMMEEWPTLALFNRVSGNAFP